MKTLILTLIFFLPFTATAQQNTDNEIEQYLHKSIAKKKTANILLITGGGLILTGIVVASSKSKKNDNFFTGNQVTGSGIIIGGILSAVTSIPFYISAAHNKRKSLKIAPTAAILPVKTDIQNENYAVIGLKISF